MASENSSNSTTSSISSPSTASRHPPRSPAPVVLVLGSGIAGIAAAAVLHKNRIPFLILEARNRIGGRIHTDYESLVSTPVCLGAQWIHGIDGNPLYTIAKQSSRLVPTERTIIWTPKTFKRLSFDTSMELTDRTWELINRATAYAKKHNSHLSWHDYIQMEAPWWKKGLDQKLIETQKELFQFKDSFEATDGSVWSLKQMALEREYTGDHVLVCDGYKRVLNKVGQDFLHESEKYIRLSCQVETIDYASDKSMVKVYTNQGVFSAPYVISTIPLGVMKASHTKLFQPNLPTHKQLAIDHIKYGTLNKVVLQFKTPFWNAPFQHLENEMDWFWGFLQLAPQKMAERMSQILGKPVGPLKKKTDNWLIGYLNLYPIHKTPTLVCYVHAELGNYIECLPNEEIAALLLDHLRKMFPEQSDAISEQSLVNMIATRWGKDPYALGSYSHLEVGPASKQDFQNLAQPLDNKVFFAGEHTHSENFGTVHGAYFSGLREGQRVAEVINGGSSSSNSIKSKL